MADTYDLTLDLAPLSFSLEVAMPPLSFETTIGLGGSGSSSGSEGFTALAGEALSGHRMVTTDALGRAVYPSGHQVAGMTIGAALAGAAVEVVTGGVVDEPTWSWTPGQPLFLRTGGFISHAPEASYVREIGVALTPTKIKIEVQPPIVTA